jgi:parallel beta-helix repeat protein
MMILTIFLLSLLGVAFKVQKVEASGTIYIMADGSVVPSDAPIKREGDVYAFTEDIINNSIVVERKNVEIDGAEHNLQGTGIYSGGSGFYLSNVTRVTIKRVKISEFYWGVQMFLCSDCALLENEMSNNGYGVHPNWCNNSLIARNKVVNNEGGGIYLTNSFNFSVEDNTVTLNRFYGIRLTNSQNSTLIENVITNNTGDGIHMVLSSNNVVYHNNFVDNTRQAHAEGEVTDNVWDDGYPSGGNYWSNYAGVDSNNTDYYPLMGPFHSFNTSLGKYVNVISNSTIEDFEYFKNNSMIRMHVSNMTYNQVHGFCRVCIPHDLMFEPFNVTINGVNPIYWNYTLYDNGTHRWTYFEYEHSELEIVIMPEFPSFLILTLFIIATLLTTIIYKRKQSS